MKCVKNDVVKMLWEADKFFENNGAFVAAVQVYNGVPVVFYDNDVFLLLSEENCGEVAGINEIVRILQDVESNGYIISEAYEDLYIPLLEMGTVDDSVLESYGIGANNKDDIINRLSDLYPYFEVTYVEDVNDAY